MPTATAKNKIPDLTIDGRDNFSPELAEQLKTFNADAREWAARERELQRQTAAVGNDAADVSSDELTSRSGEVRSLRLKQAQQRVALLRRRRSLLREITQNEWGRMRKDLAAAKREAIDEATRKLTEAGLGVDAQLARGLPRPSAEARLRAMALETPEVRAAEERLNRLADYMMSLRQGQLHPMQVAGGLQGGVDRAIADAEAELDKIIRQQSGL